MRRMCLVVVACLLLAACDRFVEVEVRTPDLDPVDAPEQSFVYAADGSLLATFRFAFRENVAREDLPQVLVDAVLAAEDRRFYEHSGVDARAILRAVLANRRAGGIVQGGSTITQQLVKNRYFPVPENTLERKAMEAHLALQLEREATKDEILVDYLNTVYFGAGAYGIEAAARTYFGIGVGDLDVAQSALLAGLLQSPESSSPYDAPQRAVAERQRVLDAMVEVGTLTPDVRDAVAAAPLAVEAPPDAPPTRYPHFVEYVKRSLVTDPRFGFDEPSRWRYLYGGGLRIHTSIDPALQAHAEAASRAFLSSPEDPEVAISVVRPGTGEVVASVGGRDFSASQFDLATQGRRQPGSTFKVFALAAALQRGWRLDDAIEGGGGAFPLPGGEVWNVSGSAGGRVSLREAIVRSSNGAFARLALDLGGDVIAQQAAAMGITSTVGANPSIVLGGLRDGVSPLEMAGAFATLANGGIHVPPHAVVRIEDRDGAVVWEPDADPRVAMDAGAAWLVTDALRGVLTDGTGRNADIGRPAAGKTGTVQEYRDAWFVGYTPELSAAVWVGYPDAARPLLAIRGEPRVEGGTWPARIWREFMRAALAGQPVRDFSYPVSLVRTVEIDPLTGGIATPYCPTTVELRGLPAELPTHPCPLHTAAPAMPSDPSPAAAPPNGSTTAAPPAPPPSEFPFPQPPQPALPAPPEAPPTAPPPPPPTAPPTAPEPSPTATATEAPSPTTPPPPAPPPDPPAPPGPGDVSGG